MSFDKTQRVLLYLLSNALFQKPLSLESDIDWKEVYKESVYQAVSTLVFSALPKEVLPSQVSEKWEYSFNVDLLSNSQVSYAHSQVHGILSDAGIPYVILKGCVSASYYTTPMLRKLGDVDFLVPPNYFEQARKLFLENGFKGIDTNHEYEVEFRKDDVVYELHRRVNGVPDNELGVEIEKLFADIFDKSVLIKNEFAQYYSPSVFHHGLIMLLHVARHMITGGIGLRHLCDWAVFVASVGDDFALIFEDKLNSIGLWKFAQILTQLCVEYLGCPAQSFTAGVDKQLLLALKDDIFAGGNFGRKDIKRSDEAKFITSRKDGGVSKKSNVKQSVISANEIVRRHWKFASKVPVVYPFGWVYYGTKYVIKTLFGKRERKNIVAIMNGADKRKQLYNELKLFEK